MNSYDKEYTARQIREAAQRVIEAAAVGVFPHTVAHRTEQLKAITDTLTPHDWLELLKVK